jgi:hypothetical protein
MKKGNQIAQTPAVPGNGYPPEALRGPFCVRLIGTHQKDGAFDPADGFQADVQDVDYGHTADFPQADGTTGVIKGFSAQDYRRTRNCHGKPFLHGG